MEQVLAPENLHRAWRRVKTNAGAPGIDGMTVDAFPAFSREHWARIRSALMKGTYRPAPVRRVFIPKPDGQQRPLGVPTVLDRVIQQALAQVLTPLFESGFNDHSYGFRQGRSRKSYWHLSRTMATQSGMTNAWLQSQGLISMRELWIASHYPAANLSGFRAASR